MSVTLFPGLHVQARNFSGVSAAVADVSFKAGWACLIHFFPHVGTSSRRRDSHSRLLSHDFCLLSCSQMRFFETFIQKCVWNPQPGTPELQKSSPAQRMLFFFKSTIHIWCATPRDESSRLRALVPHSFHVATPQCMFNLMSSFSAGITVGVLSQEELAFCCICLLQRTSPIFHGSNWKLPYGFFLC